MAHAEKCPVCHGKGKIAKGDSGYLPSGVHEAVKTCHGCGGLGWVTVQDASVSTLEVKGQDNDVPGQG